MHNIFHKNSYSHSLVEIDNGYYEHPDEEKILLEYLLQAVFGHLDTLRHLLHRQAAIQMLLDVFQGTLGQRGIDLRLTQIHPGFLHHLLQQGVQMALEVNHIVGVCRTGTATQAAKLLLRQTGQHHALLQPGKQVVSVVLQYADVDVQLFHVLLTAVSKIRPGRYEIDVARS